MEYVIYIVFVVALLLGCVFLWFWQRHRARKNSVMATGYRTSVDNDRPMVSIRVFEDGDDPESGRFEFYLRKN